MKLIVLSTLLILAFVPLAFGQGKTQKAQKVKCTLTVDRAPELRGFLLTMNQERLLTRFPGITIARSDEFSVVKLRINVLDPVEYRKGSSGRDKGVPSSGRDKGVQFSPADTPEGRLFVIDNSRFPDLKGVRNIQLRLLDGRLSYIQIGYDDSVKWDSSEEFVKTISKTLGLPGVWRDGDGEENKLQCDGFLISATLEGDVGDPRLGPQLSLEDTTATQTVEKREKEREEQIRRKEEERRKTFKP